MNKSDIDAIKAMRDNANERLLDTLRAVYPVSSKVSVSFERSGKMYRFTGVVEFFSYDCTHIHVRNLATGKVSKRYYEHVDPIRSGTNQ